jgi:hypothetical protein
LHLPAFAASSQEGGNQRSVPFSGRFTQSSASTSLRISWVSERRIPAQQPVCSVTMWRGLCRHEVANPYTNPSPVEPYRHYLEERWQQGEVMISTLWHELQEQGFRGSYKSVWTFVRKWPLPAGMTPTSSSSCVAPSTHRKAATTPTPRPGQMALVASARGSECKGCGLSTGIVRPFPTPFVSGGTCPGLCSPDSGA